MPKADKNLKKLKLQHIIDNPTTYTKLTSIIDHPSNRSEENRNTLNRWTNNSINLFNSDHIKEDLINRLHAGAKTCGEIRKITRLPYTNYIELMSEGKDPIISSTYRAASYRELGPCRIEHINYEFRGNENLPKLGGTGSWSIKHLRYEIDVGLPTKAYVYYRLYYTYLKFFFNVQSNHVDVHYKYTVYIFNACTGTWENIASPS